MLVKFNALVSICSHLLLGLSLATAQVCSNTGNFTTDSAYGRNRDLILASLAANVSANGGFFIATIGQDSNKVYALGLCTADSSSDVCHSSVNSTVHSLIAKCPNQKEAISWGSPPSIVRYTDRWVFENLELEPTNKVSRVDDIKSNLTEFDLVWERLTDAVVRNASMGSSRLKYATGEAYYSTFEQMYAQMQCTPDLSQKDCDSCLRESVSNYLSCCRGKLGGVIQKPSCLFRWEVYPFYVSNASTTAVRLSPPAASGSPPPAAPASPSPPSVNNTITKGGGISSQTLIVIVVPVVIFVGIVTVAILSAAVLLKRREKTKQEVKIKDEYKKERLQFDFNAVRVATNNFSDINKLGAGGFGSVYKGRLHDGQDIAVKRLSRSSNQGEQEFKNEVLLMAKLEHKNLVRLVGFCLEHKERILIYEFLPNSSLDHFIFDPIKRLLLNWEKRYKIIEGIAKGLLYLHEDSQYRIIHRDLKAANILLDAKMNPKIADFGMAKLFAVDQSQADTKRIVGPYGYMAPEYAMNGHFSIKSDVYSFGVLVLEIISSKRISKLEEGESLLSHAWRNWNAGTALNIVDPILRDGSRSESEMMRCIQLGLLCVQENIAYRPTMASVVLMLSSYSISLRAPSRPAFVFMESINEVGMESESSISDQSKTTNRTVQASVNEASFSEFDPR